jgi:hypothetical protein
MSAAHDCEIVSDDGIILPGSSSSREGTNRARRPPLLIRLTGYNLLTFFVTVGLVAAKAKASQEGRVVVSSTLDWVLGGIIAIA